MENELFIYWIIGVLYGASATHVVYQTKLIEFIIDRIHDRIVRKK